MIALSKKQKLLSGETHNLWTYQNDKMLVYERSHTVFAFNFHPTRSFNGYFIPVSEEGEYKVILSSDDKKFGGQDRISTTQTYQTEKLPDGRIGFLVYLPSRCAMVLKKKRAAARKKSAEPKAAAKKKAK